MTVAVGLASPEPCTEAVSLRDREVGSQERRRLREPGFCTAGWLGRSRRRLKINGNGREEDVNST